MQDFEIDMPLGYRIETITETMDPDCASALLSTKKRKRYTSAIRCEEKAELTRHIWICPYCGERTPAYPRFFNESASDESVCGKEIERWGAAQLSFFGVTKPQLNFNRPVLGGAKICPHCGETSYPLENTRKIRFTDDSERLSVSAEIFTIQELFSLDWASRSINEINFPLYETALFDFKEGTVLLQLKDSFDCSYAVSDMTQKPESWRSGVLYEALTKRKAGQRLMKRLFLKHYGGKLPFSDPERTLEKYVLMTRFIGYPPTFFHAIPFSGSSCAIDDSFKDTVKKLHKAENVPEFYEKSELPQTKTIRKLFFEDPGLFFYLDECQRLWKIFRDVNLFRKLLSNEGRYEILSQFHSYPAAGDYYERYADVKGAKALLIRFEKSLTELNFDAIFYAAMNSCAKKEEEKKWISETAQAEEQTEIPPIYKLPKSAAYSIPMHEVSERIKPCFINGYGFLWLYSRKDYLAAGEELGNCLIQWERTQNPVLVIYRCQKAVGAIEVNVKQYRIVQALGKRNRIIIKESFLWNAFEKWEKKYGLEKYSYPEDV